MWKPGRRKHVKLGRPKCENLDVHVFEPKIWTIFNMICPKCENLDTHVFEPKMWTIFNEIWLLYRQDLMFFQPTKN